MSLQCIDDFLTSLCSLQPYPVPRRISVLPSALPPEVHSKLVSALSPAAVSIDDQERVRHGTGHCLSDILELRTSNVKRSPDAVVYPSSQEDVVAIVKIAELEDLCLIPFGGGTNVSSALACPNLKAEPRCIVSVDMKRMAQLLWCSEEDSLCCFEVRCSESKTRC